DCGLACRIVCVSTCFLIDVQGLLWKYLYQHMVSLTIHEQGKCERLCERCAEILLPGVGRDVWLIDVVPEGSWNEVADGCAPACSSLDEDALRCGGDGSHEFWHSCLSQVYIRQCTAGA